MNNQKDFDISRLPRTVELIRPHGVTTLAYIDQRKLPQELLIAKASTWQEVVDAIKTLAVRGAPALGVTGAAALAIWTSQVANEDMQLSTNPREYRIRLKAVTQAIAQARPTAVNLSWGVYRAYGVAVNLLDANGATHSGDMHAGIDAHSSISLSQYIDAHEVTRSDIHPNKGFNAQSSSHKSPSFNLMMQEIADRLFLFVKEMETEDERTNRQIGEYGAALLGNNSQILTHCNAGSLATVFYGTALGVVYAAAAQRKVKRVYADETRPVGQGARLTAWELVKAGVPTTLICDDMAASLMEHGDIDAVIVGADRITANGDTANKIGTYGLAVLAKHHSIPFYVAAPFSTFDATLANGRNIPIEQRDVKEVLRAPIEGVDVWNPAFDVTPAHLITGVITERGVFAPSELIKQL